MPKPRYCYWSVATGAEADDLEACVRSAREAGVHRDFHVLTDRVIEGAECYDAYECDRAHGLYKLHYLKAGMTRLNVDWFVWVDPRTRFLRNPVDVLSVVGASPIHVPLEAEIGVLPGEAVWRGMPAHRLAELMIRHGVYNPPRLSGSECWSVHHDVIELVHNLAMGFWHKAKEAGWECDVAGALGFAAQLLCSDAERHRLEATSGWWAPVTEWPSAASWMHRHWNDGEPFPMKPALVSLRPAG
jgi:hypothetical protein